MWMFHYVVGGAHGGTGALFFKRSLLQQATDWLNVCELRHHIVQSCCFL